MLIDKIEQLNCVLLSHDHEIGFDKTDAIFEAYTKDEVVKLLLESTQSLIAVDDVLKTFEEHGGWCAEECAKEIRKAIESTGE